MVRLFRRDPVKELFDRSLDGITRNHIEVPKEVERTKQGIKHCPLFALKCVFNHKNVAL